MERYLMTQTLLSSWGYMFNCYEDGAEEAYADFVRTLNRERGEQTEAMQNGIEFETLVYEISRGVYCPKWQPAQETNPVSGEVFEKYAYHKWFSGAKQIAEIIKGAPTQVRVQRDIDIHGMSFLLYGILDAVSAGIIYDVKFLNKSFGSAELAGKYYDSPQHPAYLYMVPEARRFEYLVSDGNDLYKEVYDRRITRPIADIMDEFVQSLEAMNLLDVYKEKWTSR